MYGLRLQSWLENIEATSLWIGTFLNGKKKVDSESAGLKENVLTLKFQLYGKQNFGELTLVSTFQS